MGVRGSCEVAHQVCGAQCERQVLISTGNGRGVASRLERHTEIALITVGPYPKGVMVVQGEWGPRGNVVIRKGWVLVLFVMRGHGSKFRPSNQVDLVHAPQGDRRPSN